MAQCLLALLTLAAAAPAQASEQPRVVIAVLPNGTSPEALEKAHGLSLGVMSAALSRVGAEQTYLDISQGNRVFDGFYKERLPFLLPLGKHVRGWGRVEHRAESAPAELVPGLMASALQDAARRRGLRGFVVQADPTLLTPALVVANRHGQIQRAKGACGMTDRCPSGVTIEPAFVGMLPRMIARLRGDDMLIAFERAPPIKSQQMSIGIAGRGFDGNLISDSTRLTGLVLATDVAPTILGRFGVPTPKQMLGRPIHTKGRPDADQLISLQNRLSEIVPRRAGTIGTNILLWVLLTALALPFLGPRRGRKAMALLGLSCIYLPGLLLPGAALEPSATVERLLVGLGGPLLGLLTLRLVRRGYASLAVACAVTVGAYALDLVLGTGLTPLSLMGSNPSLGVRFYGIGNELEATLTAMTLIGVGAGLSAWNLRQQLTPRAQAGWFVGIGGAATVVFAAGRFGADVGAAIVLPVGATSAALYILGVRGRRFVAIAILAPVLGVAALVALDLLIGDTSHLTRSVLHANGTHSLSDIAFRRLRSSAGSFARPINNVFLLIAVAAFIAALAFRGRVAVAFGGRQTAIAGVLGACIATLVGTVANDSGALILIIGAGVLIATACFVWSQTPPPAKDWSFPRRKTRKAIGPKIS